MKDMDSQGVPRLTISITSSLIQWDPDDEVGQQYDAYFKEATKEINSGIVHILPEAKISELQYLVNLDWEDDRYRETNTRFVLDSAKDSTHNPFLDSPSAVFNYRIIFDFDISQAVDLDDANPIAYPEVFINEFTSNFYISLYEWPRGDTQKDDWDFDEAEGNSMIPIETISFMGDIYDVYRG